MLSIPELCERRIRSKNGISSSRIRYEKAMAAYITVWRISLVDQLVSLVIDQENGPKLRVHHAEVSFKHFTEAKFTLGGIWLHNASRYISKKVAIINSLQVI